MAGGTGSVATASDVPDQELDEEEVDEDDKLALPSLCVGGLAAPSKSAVATVTTTQRKTKKQKDKEDEPQQMQQEDKKREPRHMQQEDKREMQQGHRQHGVQSMWLLGLLLLTILIGGLTGVHGTPAGCSDAMKQ